MTWPCSPSHLSLPTPAPSSTHTHSHTRPQSLSSIPFSSLFFLICLEPSLLRAPLRPPISYLWFSHKCGHLALGESLSLQITGRRVSLSFSSRLSREAHNSRDCGLPLRWVQWRLLNFHDMSPPTNRWLGFQPRSSSLISNTRALGLSWREWTRIACKKLHWQGYLRHKLPTGSSWWECWREEKRAFCYVAVNLKG